MYTITHDDIKETKTFKSSEIIRQKMILKFKSFKEIEHAFNVALNIGYIKWSKQSNLIESKKLIVKDLINKKYEEQHNL